MFTIPREAAVFWLDSDGYWNNEGGRFELPKIIRCFHRSIERDEGGYYVTQINGDQREKVYFPYEDTPLFAIDIKFGETSTIRLNTGKRLPLIPDQLYSTNDSLYMKHNDERIKFSERALLKISALIDFNSDPWRLHIGGHAYSIGARPTDSAGGGVPS